MTDLTLPVGSDSTQETAWTATARRERHCEAATCTATIRAGEDYVRLVAFPGHDVVGGDRPWVMHLCTGCATEYGRPLPPRRTRKDHHA